MYVYIICNENVACGYVDVAVCVYTCIYVYMYIYIYTYICMYCMP